MKLNPAERRCSRPPAGAGEEVNTPACTRGHPRVPEFSHAAADGKQQKREAARRRGDSVQQRRQAFPIRTIQVENVVLHTTSLACIRAEVTHMEYRTTQRTDYATQVVVGWRTSKSRSGRRDTCYHRRLTSAYQQTQWASHQCACGCSSRAYTYATPTHRLCQRITNPTSSPARSIDCALPPQVHVVSVPRLPMSATLQPLMRPRRNPRQPANAAS
ncbi:hypothetical protein EVAR_89723_1 [Eumeta japonica]|uniref:Uncharacterized protein n=1 Tax=Eumeta variegata TaxID=151549 RepID=A0A4C1Y760_EUMVA|nr:hypothetical protein EVAR_89723_1 [Eumeta japonica]